MFYLIAFLLPPAALLIIGKPVQALVNMLAFGAVWLCLLSPIITPFILWVGAATHALLAIMETSPAKQPSLVPMPRRRRVAPSARA